MTLVEFLMARIADDEAVAQKAAAGHPEWEFSESSVYTWDIRTVATNRLGAHEQITFDREGLSDSVDRDAGPHIARHDPARVLAECEAKRGIMAEHGSEEVASLDRATWAQTFIVCRRCREGDRQVVAPCPTLRLLALPYADHPDYDEVWRP